MRNSENTRKAFLELVEAGLWGNGNPDIRIDGTTDWQEVYRLATEQSVLGLILDGLEHSDVKPPQVLLLQWIGEVQMIEQRNKAMNKMLNEVGFGIGLRLFESVSKDNVASYRSALSASNVKVVKEMEGNELYLEILP